LHKKVKRDKTILKIYLGGDKMRRFLWTILWLFILLTILAFPSIEHIKPIKAQNTNYSDNDLKLMANAVYGEARGEPYIGQVAVAAVILNRLKSSSFPDTISGVIFEPRAFTAVADGQIWLTPNDTAKKAVKDALNGWDPTDGSEYYFNPETATSKWIWSRPQIKKIGKHIFCR